MIDKKIISEKLKQNLSFLKKEYSIKHIGLFGSYASDNYTKKSDIDLLIEFENPIGFRFFALIDFLESLLGKKVDIITSQGLHSIRHENVKKSIRDSTIYV